MTREEQLACLEDRPCSVCKFHTDRCNRWTCVFEDEPEEQGPCSDAISLKSVIEWLKTKDIIKLSSQEETARKELKALSSGKLQSCEDCISRQQAINKMQELEDEDIEAYGCSIPEGFDGKRAIEALKALPSIQPTAKENLAVEDCISRQAVLDLINSDWKYEGLETEINDLPSIQPKPKIGHWIEGQKGLRITDYKCSECGRTVMDDSGYDVNVDYPFCHCGARMVEPQESEG